jgi:hypothetical protein
MADTQAERLANFLDAEKKALISQEWRTADGRVNRRADLGKISQGVDALLSSGADGAAPIPGSRAKRVILRDL